jgi:hypothetical protein
MKLNVAAQHNSRRELAMVLKVKTKPLYLAEAYSFATLQECVAVPDNRLYEKLTIALPLGQHCAAVNP